MITHKWKRPPQVYPVKQREKIKIYDLYLYYIVLVTISLTNCKLY